MREFHQGTWAVTTTDDAHGIADGVDPETADPLARVWAVYDQRYDEEPVAQDTTHDWACKIATALHLMDQVAPVLGALEAEPMPARVDPYDAVEAKGYYVLCCKECDGDRILPMPFSTTKDRSEWRTQHTLGTGHHRYVLVDPKPVQLITEGHIRGVSVDTQPGSAGGNVLPEGFALAGEVSLGAITAGPSASGHGLLMKLDERGRPIGPSLEVSLGMMFAKEDE